MPKIGEIAKTVYGSGDVVKVTKSSVWVFVGGEKRKFTMKQWEILNAAR